jgi:hypothetical protein
MSGKPEADGAPCVLAADELPVSVRAILARCKLRSPRQQKFVEYFVLHGNGAAAARAAGYSPRRDRQTAAVLMKAGPVVAAIAEARRALAEAAEFTMDRAMQQLREDREFAIRTENATAAVRASELMAKLSGHLVERIDARIAVGFSVALHIPAREVTNG